MLFSSDLKNSKSSSRKDKIKTNRVKVHDRIKSTEQSLRIPFDANRSGKILDYMGRDVEKIDETVSAEDSKELFAKLPLINPFKKGVPNGQVFTGNIAIDFTDPIPVGSFAYFRGSNNTGFKFSCLFECMYLLQIRENADCFEHNSSISQQQSFL
jgi:F0F1-type ATP synthase alpha subunit